MSALRGWFAWRDVVAGWRDYHRTPRRAARRLGIPATLDYRIGWSVARWLGRGA